MMIKHKGRHINKSTAIRYMGDFILRILSTFLLVSIFLFLLAPIIVVVIVSFSEGKYLVFPPTGFSLRWYVNFFSEPGFVKALRTSLLIGSITSVVSLIFGVMASIALVKYRFRGRDFFNSFFLAPLTFPSIVLALALVIFFGRIRLSGSFFALICSHVIVTVPYVIRSVSATLYGFENVLLEAAANLGANPWQSFRRVMLPLVKSGVIAGAIFAFIISFDELVITLFVAGPRLTTLPVKIFNYIEYTSDPTVAAISSILVFIMLILGSLMPRAFMGV